MTDSVSSNWDSAAEISNLDRACEKLVSVALNQGAHHVDVGASVSQGVNVTVRNGQNETLEYQKDRSMGLNVWVNGCKGSASTNDLSDAP